MFPTVKKKYKACMICSSLHPLSSRNAPIASPDNISCPTCKSLNSFSYSYKGLIAVTNNGGWVERWQRLDRKGLFAIVVEGVPDEDDLNEYEGHGGTYFDRSQSFKM